MQEITKLFNFTAQARDIISPLDQFEIQDLLSMNAPILGALHISITNIGLYLMIGVFFILTINLLSTNYNRLVGNNWSISQESLYATIHSIVINQINPRNGQIYLPFIYALFIFILINNLIGMVEGSLEIILYKTSISYFLTFKTNNNIIENNKVRFYSSPSFGENSLAYNKQGNNTWRLNPHYITGFVDAEGCFTTSIFMDERRVTKWQVKPIFKISLHNKDRKLLEALQRAWDVGNIHKHGKDSIEYRVSSIKNLKVIINHLDQYPLITKKLADYLLFKQSVALIEEKQHLTMEGLLKLVGIKASLNWGLSEKFKQSFPSIIPAERPEVKPSEIKDIHWWVGFVEGEGCFLVTNQKSKSQKKTYDIGLKFTITQHNRDLELLQSFSNYLGCGKCYSNRNEVSFIISSFSDINSKIIPIFDKYPLLGTKKEDYKDFKKVAELMESKYHLTEEGIKNIILIKSNMNSKRIPDYKGR